MKARKSIIAGIIMCLLVTNTLFCFADSSTLSEEKKAILNQVPEATLDEDGNLVFPLSESTPIVFEVGGEYRVEYTIEASNARSTTKEYKIKKTITHIPSLSYLTLYYTANCTWGSPTRCVTMNSFVATYSGVRASVDNFSYKITEKVSSAGGYARARCSGKVSFSENNNIVSGVKSFEHEIYADSANSANIFVKEIN